MSMLLNSSPMRLTYTAFLLFFVTSVFSQELQFAPLEGNSILKNYAAKKEAEKEAYLKHIYDLDINESASDRSGLNCCPFDELPFGLNVVESGSTIEIELDTFGLAVDSTPPIITLLTDPPLLNGSVVYVDSIITVRYSAMSGIASIAADTVNLRYEQGGEVDTILEIAYLIKRKGKEVVTPETILNPSDIVNYCLDDELDFPFGRACFQFEDCFSGYDGDGYQFKYFYNDSCFVYLASRFPGTDTVCVQICDSIGICDIFKIPFTIVGETLSLTDGAFFEDFSSSNGPYPRSERWLEDDVFVNRTFSPNPPSVGMATFDGLDSGGSPYELPAGGFGDQLTSKRIDLSSNNANNNVYLRFFITPKGYGQEPEDDDFVVEFRDKNLEWIEVALFDGTGNLPFDSIPPWAFQAIKIEDQDFFHDKFQMRFRAQTSPGGYGDWWHLDYIHLDANETDVNVFSDMAMVSPPSGILKNYTSMPWMQFEGNESKELDSIFTSNIFNHENMPQNIDDSNIELREETTNNIFTEPITLGGGGTNVAANSIVSFIDKLEGTTLDNYKNWVEGISFDQYREITTNYSLDFSAEGAEFKVNDTVETSTIFSDYYAHDDGTAEVQFFWINAIGGEEVANQFKTNVGDSLRGVQFMFPHFSFFDIEGQFFTLKVWLGDASGPDTSMLAFEQEFMQPFFPDEIVDTLQGFTTYKMEDILGESMPLFIPADTYFYVGFEQVNSSVRGIPVGYDLNNPCDCNYLRYDQDTTFTPFSANLPSGAMMIRPVFGNVVSTANAVDDVENETTLVAVFPNPVQNELNVRFDQSSVYNEEVDYIIFNQMGQLKQQGSLNQSISTSNLPDGNYYLQLHNKKTGELWVNKFVIIK